MDGSQTESITNISATALHGTGPAMLTNSNSSQVTAIAQEDMAEQQLASTAGGDVVTNETNQAQLDQLVDGISTLRREIQLRQELSSRSLGSAQPQSTLQSDLPQLQTGFRPQQLQDLQQSGFPPRQQGFNPFLPQGLLSQPQLGVQPQQHQSSTVMGGTSEQGQQQRQLGIGQQLQLAPTSSEIQLRQFQDLSTLMHRFQSPSQALPGQFQPNVSPPPQRPTSMNSPINVLPRQLLSTFHSETTSGSMYHGPASFTPFNTLAGQKGEPFADPLALQNKIFAASQQAMQQGPRLQQMLVHNETTGHVMWDLSHIAQQNKERIESMLAQVHDGASAASRGYPLIVGPTAEGLSKVSRASNPIGTGWQQNQAHKLTATLQTKLNKAVDLARKHYGSDLSLRMLGVPGPIGLPYAEQGARLGSILNWAGIMPIVAALLVNNAVVIADTSSVTVAKLVRIIEDTNSDLAKSLLSNYSPLSAPLYEYCQQTAPEDIVMLTVTQYVSICTVLHDVLAPFCSPSVARKFTEPRLGASNADQQLLTLPWFFNMLLFGEDAPERQQQRVETTRSMMEQLLPAHLLPEELRQAAGQRFLAYQLAHQTPFQVNPEGEWRAIEKMLNPKYYHILAKIRERVIEHTDGSLPIDRRWDLLTRYASTQAASDANSRTKAVSMMTIDVRGDLNRGSTWRPPRGSTPSPDHRHSGRFGFNDRPSHRSEQRPHDARYGRDRITDPSPHRRQREYADHTRRSHERSASRSPSREMRFLRDERGDSANRSSARNNQRFYDGDQYERRGRDRHQRPRRSFSRDREDLSQDSLRRPSRSRSNSRGSNLSVGHDDHHRHRSPSRSRSPHGPVNSSGEYRRINAVTDTPSRPGTPSRFGAGRDVASSPRRHDDPASTDSTGKQSRPPTPDRTRRPPPPTRTPSSGSSGTDRTWSKAQMISAISVLQGLADSVNPNEQAVALQKVVRILQTNMIPTGGSMAALSDSGAQIALGTKAILRYLVSEIMFLDKAMPIVAGFDNAQSNLITLIGMAYAMFPTINMDGSITPFLYLIYITKEDWPDLLILPTSQCQDQGGVTIYGTGQRTDIFLKDQDGKVEKHSLNGNISAMGSSCGRGLTELRRNSGLYYLPIVNPADTALTTAQVNQIATCRSDMGSLISGGKMITQEMIDKSYVEALAHHQRKISTLTSVSSVPAGSTVTPPAHASLICDGPLALETDDNVKAMSDTMAHIEAWQVAYYNRPAEEQNGDTEDKLGQLYESMMGFVSSFPEEVQRAVHQHNLTARQASVRSTQDIFGAAGMAESKPQYPIPAVEIDLQDLGEPAVSAAGGASVNKVLKRTLAEVADSEKPQAKEIDPSQFLHRPNGLTFVMFGTVLPLLALMLLTLYPDANVYLFTNTSTSSVLNMVPIPQISRVHCAPFFDFQAITRESLAIWLQDYNLSFSDIDLLYSENMELDSNFTNFRQLAHDLQRLFPQLLVASRSCTSDYSLGAPSKYQHNYDIHYPAAKVQHHQFASDILVDTDSQSRTTDHDDEMKYIQFAYLLQETLDDIIHDAYGKLPSVGLLCYPEIQDLVINEFTAAEQEWCYENVDDDAEDESYDEDDPTSVSVNAMTRSASSRVAMDDQGDAQHPRKRRRTEQSAKSNPRPEPLPTTYIIEIGAGSATWTCDHLDANPGAFALCIDIMSPLEFWRNIPQHLRPRIQYHRAAPEDHLTLDIAESLLKRYFGPTAQPEQVMRLHFSPECQTLSNAGVNGTFDIFSPQWRHPHRRWDGKNFVPLDHSDKARADDLFRTEVLLQFLLLWSKKYPHVQITVENPDFSLFVEMSDVKFVSEQEGWLISRADHCILADPTFDSIVTQKRSVYLTFGYAQFDVACTKTDRCQYLIPTKDCHQYVIRINKEKRARGQIRVDDPVLRSRIPRGVCAFIRLQGLTGKATPPETSGNSDKPRRKCRTKVMPLCAAKLWHCRFGHCGRSRLYRALRDFAFLKHYILPSKIPCESCDKAKAKRKSHKGHLEPAQFPNQVWHMDLINFLTPDIHGNLHALVMVDGKSRLKEVYAIKRKNDAIRAIQEHLALIRIRPESFRVDEGGEFKGESATGLIDLCISLGIRLEVVPPGEHEQHGIVERANQTLTRMAAAMLMSANLGKEFWSYALKYAAYADRYLSSSDSLPTPYRQWHGILEHQPRLTAFGTPLIYRQQEKARQHKLDPRGHRAIFLGYANEFGTIYVLDLDEPSKPIRMTVNDLKRTYQEELVIDYYRGEIINPESLILSKNNTTGELSIVEALEQHTPPVLTSMQKAKLQETQEFCSRRRAELYLQTEMTATQIESTILRELRLEEFRQSQLARQQPQPMDVDEPLLTADCKPTTTPTPPPESKLNRHDKERLQFIDVECSLCHHTQFDGTKSGKSVRDQVQIILCDRCDRGFHVHCLEMHWQPAFSKDSWLCFDCLLPSTRIEIKMKRKKKTSFLPADVVEHNHDTGLTAVRFANASDIEQVDLRRFQWRQADAPWVAKVATVQEAEAIAYNIPIPKSMQQLNRMPESEWKKKWQDAALKEMQGMWQRNAWKLIDKVPQQDRGKPILPMVLVFKYKPPKVPGEEGIFKVRCCLLGNRLDKSTSSVPAPTPRISTVKFMLSMAAKQNMHVLATDVTQAFLNAQPKEYNYVRIPSGFPGQPYDGQLAILCLAQYGHPAAPACWATFFSNWMICEGFTPNKIDACLFQRQESDGTTTYVLNYIDDSLCFSVKQRHVTNFKQALARQFQITADKTLSRYLGIEIKRTEAGFLLSQTKLVQSLYDKALPYIEAEGLTKANKVPILDSRLKKISHRPSPEEQARLNALPYRNLLGGVGYLVTSTMPSVAYAFKECARFCSAYSQEHWRALLELIVFIKENPTPLFLSADPNDELHAYCDADWNNSAMHLSTTGYVIFHGTNPISWSSRTQRNTARSVGESEFISLSSCAQELLHLRALKASIQRVRSTPVSSIRTLSDKGHAYCIFQKEIEDNEQVHIHNDSSSTRANLKKSEGWQDGKLRHVKTSFQFVRGHVKMQDIALHPVKGKENCSDCLTKGYANGQFKEFHKYARMCHGFPDRHNVLQQLKDMPTWEPGEQLA